MVDDRADIVSFQINNEEVPLPLELPIQLSENDKYTLLQRMAWPILTEKRSTLS